MKTAFTGRFVVGFRGDDHCLIENGTVVYEDDKIVFVGKDFPGTVDRRIDAGNAVIGPGFIDLDALGDLDSTVLCVDNHPHWMKGRLWTSAYVAAGPRDAYTPGEEAFKMHYSFVQHIRNGTTTVAPVTSILYRAWSETCDEFVRVGEIAEALGIRAYIGPAYRSGYTYVDADGKLARHWDEERGLADLERAAQFVKDIRPRHGGLVLGMLAPDRVETCTPRFLQATRQAAEDLDCPVRLHCCQSEYEFSTVMDLHGRTPVQYVQDQGLLSRQSILPHGIYLSSHSRTRQQIDTDIALLSASGASVVHCPVVMMRMGHAMESFERLSGAGINIALGTDTFPIDMIENMRAGVSLCRLVERRPDASSAADLYRAATIGGANALRRADLGRLAPGCKADFTVFDLDNTHIGQFWDPIQTMVLNGVRGCFKTVVINGRIVMDDGQIAGVDYAELQARAQRQFEKLMASYPERCFGNQSANEIFAPSFPIYAGD